MSGPRKITLECKSVLTRSKISSLDYAVNPYLGCQHGCVYCYATFMSKFMRIPYEWGEFVGVKANAAAVLARQVRRCRPGVVCFGTVCDPYQPAELRHEITRACLNEFVGTEGFEVGVLTKSDLVLRDLDILVQLEKPDVGFTVTCLDDRLARQFEPGAPSPEKRLRAMSEIAERGIDAWGFFGPVLPTFSDSDEAIAGVLGGMQKAGASHVLVDSLNLYPRVWGRLRRFLAREFPERMDALLAVKADPVGYRDGLRERVRAAARSLDMEVEICF